MVHLEIISLKDCNAYRSWQDAPDGALLQIRETRAEDPYVGLKFQAPDQRTGTVSCLLRLDDKNLGNWTGPRSAAALDISNQLEMCVVKPAPLQLVERQQFGFLYWHEDGSIFMCAHYGDLMGYVCVKGSIEYAVGTLHYDLDSAKLYVLGKAFLRHIPSN